MLGIYSHRANDLRCLKKRFSVYSRIYSTTDWTDFIRSSEAFSGAVLGLSNEFRRPRKNIKKFTRFREDCAVLYIVDRSCTSLGGLERNTIDKCITRTDFNSLRSLASVVARLKDRSFLLRIVRLTSEQPGFPPGAGRVIRASFQAGHPIFRVQEVARRLNCDRRSLWYRWTRFVGDESDVELRKFLGWLMLLEAHSRKAPSQSWEAVAQSIKVSLSTLRRSAHKHTGSSLGRLAGYSTNSVLQQIITCYHGDSGLSRLGLDKTGIIET